ncbi:MAG: hypothetical protein JWM30_3809, partial [Burkholderia sp.]|nr:hypothetical protein [Burkholderia sp.]
MKRLPHYPTQGIRRRYCALAAAMLSLCAAPALADQIIQVGGKSPVRTIAEAA